VQYGIVMQTEAIVFFLVNKIKFSPAVLVFGSRSAMSNPWPSVRMRPSRRFCAVQFRFPL